MEVRRGAISLGFGLSVRGAAGCGVLLHLDCELGAKSTKVQISGAILVHKECRIDGFNLGLRCGEQRLADGILPRAERTLRLGHADGERVLSSRLRSLVLHRHVVVEPIIGSVARGAVIVGYDLAGVRAIAGGPAEQVCLGDGLVMCPFALIQAVFIGDVYAPVLHVEGAVVGRSLIVTGEDEEFAVIAQRGCICRVVVLRKIVRGVNTLVLPDGVAHVAGQCAIVDLGDGDIRIVIRQFVIRVTGNAGRVVSGG